MNTTYAAVADRTGIAIPAHLEAQAAIPIAATFWRQGDLYIRRHVPSGAPASPGIDLAGRGHSVVKGEADRNSHVLNGTGTFHPGPVVDRLADYGLLVVPEGGEVVLTHTGEHGSVAFHVGAWRIWSQVSHEAELRRATD